MTVTINAEQSLYVIPSQAGGYSCLGFDVCLERAAKLAQWLREQGCPCQPPTKRGTMQTYLDYCAIVEKAGEICLRGEKRRTCNVELTPQLIGLEGKRVEVVDRCGEKRRFWVGKSTGWMPIHLEIHNTRSTGGGAVTGAPFQSVRVVRTR